jgi:hypothetical protein
LSNAAQVRAEEETDSPWRWYQGVGKIHMNKGRVGEERKGKETDRCPFTDIYISLLTSNLIITRFIAQSLIPAGNRPHPNHSLKSTEDFIYKY